MATGPTYTPAASAALYPNFVGQQVGDPVTYSTYDPYIASAADIPYKAQNELLAHQARLVADAAAIILINSTASQVNGKLNAAMVAASMYNWQMFQ